MSKSRRSSITGLTVGLAFGLYLAPCLYSAIPLHSGARSHCGEARASADDCNATVEAIGFEHDIITFHIDVGSCPNSQGSYDYTVHLKNTKTGKLSVNTWTRGWTHKGEPAFEVTESPPKTSDETIDEVTDEHVRRCVCLSKPDTSN